MLQLKKDLDLTDYTVIIPSICVGNAAQLACDLLISSKQLQRVGTMYNAALIPIYGPTAYQHEPNETVAACELYENVTEKLFVFQFRAPFISKHTKALHNEIIQFIQKAGRVIVLSGSFGFEKRIIEDSPYEYKVSSRFKELYSDDLKNIKWKEFNGEQIFGSGNALQLYNALENNNIPVILLFRYLLEGDNTTDATLIIRELNEICNVLLLQHQNRGGSGDGDYTNNLNSNLQLNIPISWKLLFGNNCSEIIF